MFKNMSFSCSGVPVFPVPSEIPLNVLGLKG
jgi:hypothetical protein